MKLKFLLPALFIVFAFAPQQTLTWTPAELAAANTAKDVAYMDSVEKEIVKLCNLARLYPKKFNTIEVFPWCGGFNSGTPNEISLKNELKYMNARTALQPDSVLTSIANCFQAEQGASGETGHKRKKCTDDGYLGENCSYGEVNAKSVVMQLLIDEDVPSLGHRRNIFDTDYTRIGVAFGKHKAFSNSAVLDFR